MFSHVSERFIHDLNIAISKNPIAPCRGRMLSFQPCRDLNLTPSMVLRLHAESPYCKNDDVEYKFTVQKRGQNKHLVNVGIGKRYR